MLLVDIRNYKNINEVRKAISGENILTAIGNVLKREFRTSDVIGRIGLSEFVIFLKDVPTDHMVYTTSDKICKELESLYSYEHTKNGITVSIGVTLQRGAQDFQAIFANANTALVMAKKVPSSSFEVFNGAIGNQ
jgi:diguanylate cyclase (GGDEF)-like protein